LRRAGTARAVEWRLAEEPRAVPALPRGVTLARPSARRYLRRRGQGTRQSRRDRPDSVGRAPPAPRNGDWRKSRGQCPPYRTEIILARSSARRCLRKSSQGTRQSRRDRPDAVGRAPPAPRNGSWRKSRGQCPPYRTEITLARPSAKRCLRRRGPGTRQAHRDRPDSVGRAPPASRSGGWRKSRGQCPPYRAEITLARPSAKRCLRRRGQGTRQARRDRPDSVGRAPPAPRSGGWRKSRGQCPPYRAESPLLDHQQSGVYADAAEVRGNRVVIDPAP